MKIENVWPDWQVECEIGRGASGVVYRCVRNDNGVSLYSAIKVISISKHSRNAESVSVDSTVVFNELSNGSETVDAFVNEIRLLESLKGAPNIVSVDDFRVVEDENEWQIFIRMELLTDLKTYFANRQVTETEVIKLGTDICSALTLCERNNIVHRDIKPENIFVSRFGDFKIGDFGIAKSRNETLGTVAFKGTYSYIAPETVREFKNDIKSDMYSLGMVMYELLNSTLPFVATSPDGLVHYSVKEQAIQRRLSGEQFPPIPGVSSSLNNTILRVCSFNPEYRFESPQDFAQSLITKNEQQMGYLGGEQFVLPQPESPKKKSPKALIIIIAAVVVIVGAVVAVITLKPWSGDDKTTSGTTTIEETAEINQEITVVTDDYSSEDNLTETSPVTEPSSSETTTKTEPVTIPTMSPITVPTVNPDKPTAPTKPDCKNGHTTGFGYCERCGEPIVEEELFAALRQWGEHYKIVGREYAKASEYINDGYPNLALQSIKNGNQSLKQAIDIAEKYDEFDAFTKEMKVLYRNMSIFNNYNIVDDESFYLLVATAFSDSYQSMIEMNRILSDWQMLGEDYENSIK